jgi:DNA-binding transcriptional LysR family regulator
MHNTVRVGIAVTAKLFSLPRELARPDQIREDLLDYTMHKENFGLADLDLTRLRTFRLVVELGSFSAAAARLGLTQPAVSLQIRELERTLGTRLLERLGRRLATTAAGTELLRHASVIEAAVQAALEAVGEHASGDVGRVRLGTGATACIHLLPPILRTLRGRFPGLEITVITGNTSEMLGLVTENRIDLALVTLPVSGRTFDVTPLFVDSYLAIAPAEAEPLPPVVTPRLLAAKPLVLFEPGGSTRRLIDAWFSAAGLSVVPVMNLGNVEAIKELVGAGLGYSILPAMALRGDGRRGWVTRPLAPDLTRTLGLVIRSDKPLGRGLREVIRAFEASAATVRTRAGEARS